jgi:WD40 repeat protein
MMPIAPLPTRVHGGLARLLVIPCLLLVPRPGSAEDKVLWESTHEARRIAFSPDGKLLALDDGAGFIKLFDVSTGKQAAALDRRGFPGARSLAFSPDGKSLAVARSMDLQVWDIAKEKVAFSIKIDDEGAPNGIAYSPDGKILAASGWFHTATLHDAATGKLLATLEGHQKVDPLTFSPDGKRLATSSTGEGTVMIWDVAPRKALFTLDAHAANTGSYALAFSPDGKTLASAGGRDGVVKLIDPATGKEKGAIRLRTGGEIGALAFSPDGKRLAMGGRAEHGVLWDLDKDEAIATPALYHQNGGIKVAYSPDGKWIASSGKDRTVKLWDVSELKK